MLIVAPVSKMQRSECDLGGAGGAIGGAGGDGGKGGGVSGGGDRGGALGGCAGEGGLLCHLLLLEACLLTGPKEDHRLNTGVF